jgi:hypothetical protein
LQNDFKNPVRHQIENPFVLRYPIGLYLSDVICLGLSWNQLLDQFNRSIFVGRTISSYINNNGDQQIFCSYKKCRQSPGQGLTGILSQEIEPDEIH